MPGADRSILRHLDDPRRAFTVLAVVFGSIWVFANPAWLGFDERTHFARAWGLSGGHLVVEEGLLAPDGSTVAGDRVPSEFTDDRNTYVSAVRETDVDDLYAGYSDLLRSRPGADDDYVDTRPALAAPVSAYAPSAAPLVLVRLLDIPLLTGLWLARAANLAVYIAVVRYALGRAVGVEWLVAIAALVPLNLYVAASVTPDGLVIAGIALTVALATRLSAGEPLTTRDLVIACAVLVSVKPPYTAIALVLPAISLASNPGRWRAWAWSRPMFITATAGVAAGAWRLLAAPSYEPVAVFLEGDPFESDPGRQLDRALDEPLRFVGSVLHSTFLDLPLYARRWMFGFGPFELASSAVGSLVTIVLIAAAVALWSPGAPKASSGRTRIALGAVAVMVWLALVGANYAYFLLGVPRSFDIPARYSAPLLAAVLVVLAGPRLATVVNRRLAPPRMPQLTVVAVLAATTIRAVGVWAF